MAPMLDRSFRILMGRTLAFLASHIPPSSVARDYSRLDSRQAGDTAAGGCGPDPNLDLSTDSENMVEPEARIRVDDP